MFVLLLASLLGLNAISFMHAWRMCHFTDANARTPPPHKLSPLEKAKVLFTGVSLPKPVNLTDPNSVGLNFETIKFRGHDGSELEAWLVRSDGASRCSLLFPGYASSKSSLLNEAKTLNELGFNVFLVDFYGVGGSSGSSTSVGFHEATDVALATSYVKEVLHLNPDVLYGKSMGSAAVLRAVSEFGLTPRSLILESPFSTLLSTVENRFSRMGMPSFPAAYFLMFWGGVISDSDTFAHNPVEYATKVSSHTMIMYGAEDPYAQADEARSVFDSLKTADNLKSLIEFQGAGHVNLIHYDHVKWNQAVRNFLQNDFLTHTVTGNLR
jgi:uncharacterized protein